MSAHYLYEIEFPNGLLYYGITNDMEKRFRDHKGNARRGVAYPVYAAMRKYGVDSLKMTMIAQGSRTLVAILEITCIAANKNYNILRGGDHSPMLGTTHTDETRQKMSIAHIGRKQSPEHTARLAEARKGGTRSAESRLRMSEGQKKRTRTSAEIERLRTLAIGRTVTSQHRERLRVAAIARWSNARAVAIADEE